MRSCRDARTLLTALALQRLSMSTPANDAARAALSAVPLFIAISDGTVALPLRVPRLSDTRARWKPIAAVNWRPMTPHCSRDFDPLARAHPCGSFRVGGADLVLELVRRRHAGLRVIGRACLSPSPSPRRHPGPAYSSGSLTTARGN